MFCQGAEGLAVEGLIYRLDFGVFVTGAQGHGAVPLIQGGNAALAGLIGIFQKVLGLTAAADAAAATGPHLPNMVLLSALFHPLE